MPYITPNERSALLDVLDQLSPAHMTPGQLNYCISKLCSWYVDGQGSNYEAINAAIGVLECAKIELYRRVAVPYEDRKMAENGDVY